MNTTHARRHMTAGTTTRAMPRAGDGDAAPPRPRPPTTRERAARRIYTWGTRAFVGGLILQVFFAGLGLMVDGDQLGLHRAFGYLLFPLALLTIGAGYAARMPRRRLALTAALLPLLYLQSTLAHVPADSAVAALRALHPVNALLLFGVAWRVARMPS
jgi:hypothetical protein